MYRAQYLCQYRLEWAHTQTRWQGRTHTQWGHSKLNGQVGYVNIVATFLRHKLVSWGYTRGQGSETYMYLSQGQCIPLYTHSKIPMYYYKPSNQHQCLLCSHLQVFWLRYMYNVHIPASACVYLLGRQTSSLHHQPPASHQSRLRRGQCPWYGLTEPRCQHCGLAGWPQSLHAQRWLPG